MINLIYGKIKDMSFYPDNRNEYARFLEENESKSIVMKRETGTRSTPQNSYYWAVILSEISKHTGHTENELHEIFKRMFLPPVFIKYRGRDIKVAGSTSKLNKIEMGEYCDRIIAEAAQMGIKVPLPKKDDGKAVDYPKENLTPTF